MTRSPKSVLSFMQHADKIDTLVPTWYTVDKSGAVSGRPDPLVLKTAKEHHDAVMPIVSAWTFSPAIWRKFLNDRRARRKFSAALARIAKRQGYAGFQIDFEDIRSRDRDALSSTVAEAAAALHRAGLELTIATVPNAPGHPGETPYSRWMDRDWRAAYDLAALAKSADLICLMTYDQHTRYTPPGPVTGYPWTVENVDYALKFVPKEKLSLGIPLYGYHWAAGAPKPKGDNFTPNVEGHSISSPDALRLAQAYHGQLQWDPTDRTAWFYFYRDDVREWVFYTDARTFDDRLNLVKQRGLEGFCAWVLGEEDPAIWKLLPSHP